MKTKIEIGDIYKSNGEPPQLGAVEVYDTVMKKVTLQTDAGIQIPVTMDELDKNWTKQELATNRYFVTYTTSEGQIGRAGIRRKKTIESLADIEEIEKFLTDEKTKETGTTTGSTVTVTSWHPFEVGQGIIERTILAAQLLGFISEQDMTNVPWWTPDLKKAIDDVIS
jgi:hypothetical protein